MGESISNVTESQIEKSTEWDLWSADFPFVSEGLGIAIIGGIFAGVVVVLVAHGWSKAVYPRIRKKISRFSSDEKITLAMSIFWLIVAGISINIGIGFADSFIQVQSYPKDPNNEWTQKFYENLRILFFVGVGLIGAGLIGIGWSMKLILKIWLSDTHYNGFKFTLFSKPSKRGILRALRNKRLFKIGLKCWRYINKYITKEGIIGIIIIEIVSVTATYVIIVYFPPSCIDRLF